MFYLQIPLLIGWILPYFASSAWELYIASSVLGLGIGFMQAPIATYIGEVCQPKYRGLLACIAYCFLTLGSVAVYAIDVICGNWRHTALYCATLPPLTAIVLFLIPESPVWLISKGRYQEAKQALMWLRGWTDETVIEAELRTLIIHNCKRLSAIKSGNIPVTCVSDHYNATYAANNASPEESQPIEPDAEKEKKEAKIENKDMPFIRYFFTKEMYKPIILSLVFLYLSNGIGVAVFRSYLVLIFQDFKVEMNEYIATVGVTLIGLMGNIVCVILMPIIGKRKLTFTAIILCMFGILALGLYAIFGQHLNITWIPIALMVEIFFATNLGVGHIPWILMSEIFPLRGRTLGTGFVAGAGNFMQFLGTKLFWTYVEYLTLGGTFIMYFITFCIGLTYLYFFQVETEGRTLDEIVATFRN
ncbi:facilitated trehalose transporter Tret1-like isoform X2 [Rhodnius prolixus]